MANAPINQEEIDALEAFKALCLADAAQADSELKIDSGEEHDWFALGYGFFLGRGLSVEASHNLALLARYTHNYWC